MLAIQDIEVELEECVRELKEQGKLLEAERLESRTRYDVEMMQETGYCAGVENYSRHLARRAAGSTAVHADGLLPRGLPAVRGRVAHDAAADSGMFRGDQSRKETLVELGSGCRRRWTTGR